jgi:hypothetical protein
VARELVYLDSSAIVKLVVREAESRALRTALVARRQRATSEIAIVELRRALRRAGGGPRESARAQAVLAGLHLVRLDAEILNLAGEIEPAELRSLDAIHLASALALGSAIDVFIAYDRSLTKAAAANGLQTLSPR